MRRAQIAYEFIMVFFVFGIGFLIWIAFASSFQQDLRTTKSLENFQDFSLSLKHELFVVAQMPEGFSKKIEIPETIDNKKYKIGVTNYENTHGAYNFNFSTIQINSSDIGFYTYFNVPLMNDTLNIGSNLIINDGAKLLVAKG